MSWGNLVAIEFKELEKSAEFGLGVVVGVAAGSALEFAALQARVSPTRQVSVALGKVAGPDRDVMATRTALFEQIPPRAFLGSGFEEFEIEVAEVEHHDLARDPRRFAVIFARESTGGKLPLRSRRISVAASSFDSCPKQPKGERGQQRGGRRNCYDGEGTW